MQETFSIDENTGDISLRHTVDREQRDTYRLSVRASDGLHQSEASLILVVQDANDNIPTFAAPSFSFDVYESAGKGVQVKLTATDLDRGDNAVITYDLISDWGNEVFSLNPTTGIFTCPVGGTYMFIIHLSTHKDKVTTTILMPWSDLNFVESPAFTEEEWCGHG